MKFTVPDVTDIAPGPVVLAPLFRLCVPPVKFSDAPAFADMMARMKWVVAVDVFEAKRARTVAARAEGGLEVRKGDIVEVDFRGDPNRAKSFEEMPKVVRVVCKAGSQDFDACKQGAKMGAFDAEDNRTSWSN